VRNSWGALWGESGYIKMERNLANNYYGKCGIAMEASYPVKTTQNPPSKYSSMGSSGGIELVSGS